MNEVKLIHLVEEVVYPSKDPAIEGPKDVLSSETIPWKDTKEALMIAEEHLGQLVGLEVSEVTSKDGSKSGLRIVGMLDEKSYSEVGYTRPVVYIEEVSKAEYLSGLKEDGYLEDKEDNVRLH